MDYLTKIKQILTIDDDLNDDVLNSITDLISSRVALKIGQDKVPTELDYIVVEASISRFNRINDEGKTSSGESEVTSTWQTDDLAPFTDDLNEWVKAHNDDKAKGVFKFH